MESNTPSESIHAKAATNGELIAHNPDVIGGSEQWFRDALVRHNINLRRGTPLDLAFANLRKIRKAIVEQSTLYLGTNGWSDVEVQKPVDRDGWKEQYELYAQAYGVDFLSKALHWGASCGLVLPAERRRHFIKDDCNPLVPVVKSTKPRNEVWESVIASLAQTFASEIRFVEPDIVCDFEGQKFSIAAKVSYSAARLISLFQKGVRQVRRHNVPGLVFTNAVGVYPLQTHFVQSVNRIASTQPVDMVAPCIEDVSAWLEEHDLASLRRTISENPALAVGTACFFPIFSFSRVLGQGVPFLYPHLPIAWTDDGPDLRFVASFLHACNGVLGFHAS